MAIEWRPAWLIEETFDGYDGGLFVAQVVRYGTYGPFPTFEHLGWHWRGHFNRHGMPDIKGEFASPLEAQRAVEDAYERANAPGRSRGRR